VTVRRWLAPAGAPIGASDVARWLLAAATTADAEGALRDAVCARLDVQHAFVASTGRAALVLLLQTLKQSRPGWDEVIVPSYTCYSVAASVSRAGLRVRVVDVRPDTLDYCPDALERVDFRRVLAIVGTNLYGLPSDMPALTALGRARNVFVIDDSAQALGAQIAGRASGTWGDAGLISFDKGKNVSAVDGGVIVTRDGVLADRLAHRWDTLPDTGLRHAAALSLKALVYAAMLHPSLYGLPARIPQLGLGTTVYADRFPLERSPRVLMALATVMLGRLDTFTRVRSATAAHLTRALHGLPGISSIRPHDDAVPAYLRFPILIHDVAIRAGVLAALRTFGASGSYPSALVDVPEVRPLLANPDAPAEGGRLVARTIVTLPTHPFVSTADVEAMAALLRGAVASATPARGRAVA